MYAFAALLAAITTAHVARWVGGNVDLPSRDCRRFLIDLSKNAGRRLPGLSLSFHAYTVMFRDNRLIR